MKQKWFILCLLVLVISCKNVINDPIAVNKGNPKQLMKTLVCGNYYFPQTNFGDDSLDILWCDDTEEIYSKYEVAIFWSHLVSSPGGEIPSNVYGCYRHEISEFENSGPLETSLNQLDRNGDYFDLSWNFVYCHWYIVQRKFNNNNWESVTSFNNDGANAQTSYSNYVPYFPEGHGTVYYRILTTIYGVSSSSNELSYNY